MKDRQMTMMPSLFRAAVSWLWLLLALPVMAHAQAQQDTTTATVTSASTAAVDGGQPTPTISSGQNLVLMIRHAIAPGAGDPAGFRIGDCASQRNLSSEGIRQAQGIGQQLRARGIAPTAIWSSQWCRALDTATHLGLGQVTALHALNSFFATPGQAPAQMTQLEQFLAGLDPTKGPYIMVTHQVVITTLTGVFPASGEGVWLKLTGDKSKPWVIQSLSSR